MSDAQVLWLLGTIFLLVGVPLLGGGLRALRRRQALYRVGSWTEGTVVDLEASTSSGPGESGGRIPVYAPIVAWQTDDGRSMKTRARLAQPLDETPPLETVVTVLYDPADPTHWTLPDWGRDLCRVLIAIGGCFALIGAGLLVGAAVG